MTIDKGIYQSNKIDDKILKVATEEDPLINIELETLSTLKQQYNEEVKKGYQGSFSQWIRNADIDSLVNLKKGGRVRQKLKGGGILARETLISMLKSEYPSDYIRLSDKGFDKISTKEISDLLDNLDKGQKF